jgi:hypothetical protein
MGLAEAQRLLARLWVDAPLRDRFRTDPAAVAAEFGLAPGEAATLAALPIGPLDDFAASLVSKRRGEVQSLLPLTCRAIGPERLAALFRRHARGFVPSGIKKHRDDAVAFAGLVAREATDPPWLADLARLEGSSVLAHDPARRWTAARLRHHPLDLARAARDGNPPGAGPSLIAWFRVGRRGPLRRVVLAWPPRSGSGRGAGPITIPRSPGRP